MNATYPENGTQYLELFKAMNNDRLYDFASKCGSWNWTAIAIMLVCCAFLTGLHYA